jgi:hypothetical protein
VGNVPLVPIIIKLLAYLLLVAGFVLFVLERLRHQRWGRFGSTRALLVGGLLWVSPYAFWLTITLLLGVGRWGLAR